MTLRVAGGGLVAAILAGVLLGFPSDPTKTIAQKQRPPQQQFDLRLPIGEVAQSPAEAPVLVAADVPADDNLTVGAALASTPVFTTTLPRVSDLPPAAFPVGWALPATAAGPSTRPMNRPRPPAIAGVPPSGSPSPFIAGPPASGPPAVGGNPGRRGPTSGGPSSPTSVPDSNDPVLAGPGSPSIPGPVAPPVTTTPGTGGPGSTGPDTPIASIPDRPSNGPAPVDLPDEPNGPVVASNEPVEDWFSPGNSPGTAVIDGPFTLDGGTLLFEILGDVAGTEYDQLIVNGHVNLNTGNIVIAFIDDFTPSVDDIFDLILATSIEVGSVNVYYGFFDPADDPAWALHAPQNFGYYTLWNQTSVIAAGLTQNDTRYTVEYDGTAIGNNGQQPIVGQDFQPAVNIPTPAPLLLLATGMLLTGTFRRKARCA